MAMTKQEMLDRAVRGLASQGFEQCMSRNANADNEWCSNSCEYTVVKPDGRTLHCAWGWVDPKTVGTGRVGNTEAVTSAVYNNLRVSDLSFAARLQETHDDCDGSPTAMRIALQRLAEHHELTWPADVPRIADR